MSNKPAPDLEPWRVRLREARIKAQLRQADLARLVGRAQGRIFEYETGGGEPSLEMFEKLAWALGVTARYLIFGDDPPRRRRSDWGRPRSPASRGGDNDVTT